MRVTRAQRFRAILTTVYALFSQEHSGKMLSDNKKLSEVRLNFFYSLSLLGRFS